ncbi:glutamate--tRNA ligase [Fervidicoccus fontis]|uniref:Glutamate--tRNA ligase n=2 Tax=Fervidicoccus fontis TaxID=683846 RepID=I0A0D5_FERFK|nr:glutamate--tRNA ligase [Fervidicoccus fontis]AFH42442.1 glutamyl-tRNA synthetase [Fervidicoccus fontis Kam940]MBE9391056.1 glutamate--tRNA ligase [Fervidicoccus fontis]
MDEEIDKLIQKHVLINAIKHNGKAEVGAVVSKIVAEKPELKSSIKEIIESVKKKVEEINSKSIDEQKKILEKEFPEVSLTEEKKKEEKVLPPLPNAELYEKIITRFAPNPDFVIHLGNARPAILSHEYARMYKGKMILRFEDTDPRTKTPMIEAYSLIREDLKWLGIRWDEEYIQSLRIPIYYQIAKELILKGGAYVDDSTKQEYEEIVSAGQVHPNRNKSPEDNLELFEKMLSGYYKEGEAVLRVKTDLKYTDKSLIDWVAFRIIDTEKTPHPIVGSKYIVWPTYNFAAGVDDHLMGVTHVIRGKEHKQNTIKQSHLYQYMGWKQPETIHLGRLKLEDFIMSKSQIKRILKESRGLYSGPDDPRFGTIMGLRERGILPEAIRNLILTVGAKSSDASISYVNLASENRKIIDPIAYRIMFVIEPVYLKIDNLKEGCLRTTISYHPDNKSLGSREYEVCNGDIISISRDDYESINNSGTKSLRLMELANFEISGERLVFKSKSVDIARKEKLSIIQWVKKKNSTIASLLIPSKEELKVKYGDIEKVEILESLSGKTIQLIRVGFARVKRVSPSVELVFSHE